MINSQQNITQLFDGKGEKPKIGSNWGIINLSKEGSSLGGSSPERIFLSACSGWLEPKQEAAINGLKCQETEFRDAKTDGNYEEKFLREKKS